MNVRPLRAVLGATLTLILAWPIFAATSASGVASLRAKAEAGNAIAQYNLGLIYADETEPAHDLVEAYVWLSRAARNGARGRQLDILSERLTPAQFAEGNERLGALATPAAVPRSAGPAVSNVSDRQDRLAALSNERDNLIARLQDSDTQITSLSADLAHLRQDNDQQLSAATDRVAELQVTLEALRSDSGAREAAATAQHTLLTQQFTAAQTRLPLAFSASHVTSPRGVGCGVGVEVGGGGGWRRVEGGLPASVKLDICDHGNVLGRTLE